MEEDMSKIQLGWLFLELSNLVICWSDWYHAMMVFWMISCVKERVKL